MTTLSKRAKIHFFLDKNSNGIIGVNLSKEFTFNKRNLIFLPVNYTDDYEVTISTLACEYLNNKPGPFCPTVIERAKLFSTLLIKKLNGG